MLLTIWNETMMNSFGQQDLQRLLLSQGGPHLSIYLPAPIRPNEAQQDGTRLANLLRSSRATLVEYWMPEPETSAFISPLQEMCGDTRFLADRRTGVALFRSADTFQTYRIDTPLSETVVLGRTYRVRPILPQVLDTSCHILALSGNRVALLSATGDSIREVEVAGLPDSYARETSDVTVDRGAQVHSSGQGTAGKQAAVFHGQGGHSDTKEGEMREYLHRVDGAIQSQADAVAGPIILAGVDEMTSLYRDVTQMTCLCETSIAGNVDRERDDVLLEKASAVMAEERDRQSELIVNQLRERKHQHVATDPEQVLCAAFEGRVDKLVFDQGAELFGSFYPDSKTMKEIPHQPTGDPADPSHDLIEMAVAQTLLHRGSVYPMEKRKMPIEARLAASLRY